MGLIKAIKRGFHVLLSSGEGMGAPKGLIEFSKTSICLDTVKPIQNQLNIALIFTLLFGIGSIFYPILGIFVLIGIIFSYSNYKTIRTTKTIPIAVNLNHPFMDTDAMSDSEVMVCFNQKWINPGVHLLKLTKDPVQGWVVHKQDSDLSILSQWDAKYGEKVLSKQLTVINQAISLNNAINDSNDEFDDARARESQESELLERNWLPEEEIEVQGPLSRFFSPE